MKIRRNKLNSNQEGKKKILSDMIEKILFEEKDLEVLKNLIEDLRQEKIQPKQLRTAIIENRLKILEKILKLFPYYNKQITYQQEINSFAKNDSEAHLEKELEEKKELLIHIRNWAQNTRKKILENSNF
jgi:hypothetical protein